ncbi:hypothetical protein C8F01DRAFT_665982 [Mycena amicta]|nr:hypothetical protein C8F01DRAFT_665982 [Mycena amicta]
MPPSTATNPPNETIRSAQSIAAALGDIAQASHTPFLATTASISAAVFTKIELLKLNRDTFVQISQDIHDILRGIIALELGNGLDGALSSSVLHDIADFAETLNKLQIWLGNQQTTSKLRRLFRQNEEAAQLEACRQGIKRSLDIFSTRGHVNLTSEIEAWREETQLKHEELMRSIETDDKESTYSTSLSFSTMGASSGSLSMLPSYPQIFHGRDLELQEIVAQLLQESPRIAILGPGGVGKTCVATAALHDERVAAKYPTRHFIPCDSANTYSDLIAIVASTLGIDATQRLSQVILHHLTRGPPCLLFDNFETPWEHLESRIKVEEFLSLVTDIPHIALLITMRGAERPAQVRWTRPFLTALVPLSLDAARQTFLDIADEASDDPQIDELLEFTDNLPLAVNLVAHVASLEGCTQTLERLKSERTAALSDGHHKRANLEMSIHLSLSSPRLRSSPDAQELLSLVSLLPDGISDSDLLQSQIPIPDILKCKSTLIRTSLAYIGYGGHLRVLAPIREYVRKTRPPSLSTLRPLRARFHEVILLWDAFMHRRSLVTDLLPRLLSNMGNMQQLLVDGLDRDSVDLNITVRTIISLNLLRRVMGRGVTGLMDRLPPFLEQLQDDFLFALYTTEVFAAWQFSPVPDDVEKSVEQGLEHCRAVPDRKLEAGLSNVVAEYYLDCAGSVPKALVFFNHALDLAAEYGETVPEARACGGIALAEWFRGNYQESIRRASQQQKIGTATANTNAQISGCRLQAMAFTALGQFKQSAQRLTEGREVIEYNNLQGSEVDHMFMNSEADVFQLKTEYLEARHIQALIVSKTSRALSPVTHAYALVNVAYLDTMLGAPLETVQSSLDAAIDTFHAAKYPRGIDACDVYQADLYLREHDVVRARAEFIRLYGELCKKDTELACCCLVRLADPTHALPMHSLDETARWAAVFLAYNLRVPSATRNSLTVNQSLRCFGDVLARQGNDADALSVLEAALEGFTRMDIHQSRAECMRTMADIYLRRDDANRWREFLTTAMDLFERSQQWSKVALLEERLKVKPAGPARDAS